MRRQQAPHQGLDIGHQRGGVEAARYHSIIVNSGCAGDRLAVAEHAADLVAVTEAGREQPLHRVLGRGLQVHAADAGDVRGHRGRGARP
jgi:hypothetical protein